VIAGIADMWMLAVDVVAGVIKGLLEGVTCLEGLTCLWWVELAVIEGPRVNVLVVVCS
jgi:hypothetical protein